MRYTIGLRSAEDMDYLRSLEVFNEDHLHGRPSNFYSYPTNIRIESDRMCWWTVANDRIHYSFQEWVINYVNFLDSQEFEHETQ